MIESTFMGRHFRVPDMFGSRTTLRCNGYNLTNRRRLRVSRTSHYRRHGGVVFISLPVYDSHGNWRRFNCIDYFNVGHGSRYLCSYAMTETVGTYVVSKIICTYVGKGMRYVHVYMSYQASTQVPCSGSSTVSL
jgi:hypothetical protein